MMEQISSLDDDELITVALDVPQLSSHPLAEDSDDKTSLENPVMKQHKSKSFGGNSSIRNSSSTRSFRSPSGRPELLIEPPSYADVVFTPYNGKSLDNSRDSSRKPLENFLKISVSDPQKAQESTTSSVLSTGGGNYVTYLITSDTNIPEYEGTNFSVRRRFREVVALADKLGEVYKGYFIPVRPDKSLPIVVTQGHDFLTERCDALQKYFSRLANHPVLKKSPDLIAFLKSSDNDSFEDAASMVFDVPEKPQVAGNGSVETVKGNRDFLRAFKEFKQYVANDWGGSKPLVVEEDKYFLEEKEKIQDFERELLRSSEQAEILMKTQEDMETVMKDLGISLSKLGQFDNDEPAVLVGNAAARASRYYHEAMKQGVKHLNTFHEYLALMQAIHVAFGERSKALLRVQTLKAEIVSLKARYEKITAASLRVFGGDKRKVEELKAAVSSSEAACDLAMAEYDRIKERNREEIERYEAKRETDFLEMLKGFVHTQVAYAERIGKAWSDVVEGSDRGESSMSSSL